MLKQLEIERVSLKRRIALGATFVGAVVGVFVVIAGMVMLLVHNIRNDEFRTRVAYPFVHEIAARMDTESGRTDVLLICPSERDRVLQRPETAVVCHIITVREAAENDAPPGITTYVYITFYDAQNAKTQTSPLGKATIEFDSLGGAQLAIERW